ncbi:hypothetical protein JCM10213_004807 [Rhodosporidiobolus nylandii]
MFAFPQRHYSTQPSFDGFSTSPYSSPYAPYIQDLDRLALQQELEDRRRRAEAAAYLAEQERRQRQVALEQAILENAQRRRQLEEYEQALAYRAALIRRVEEEQEARRQHEAALAAAAARRRRQAVVEAQEREQRRCRAMAAAAEVERRRRICEARRQRQLEASPAALLDLLFTLPDVEQPTKPTPRPVKEARPAVKEPASPLSSAVPTLPSFLDLLFPLPPAVVNEEVKPAKPTPSPVKDAAPPTPVVEAPSPAPAPTPVAPEPVEPIALSASTPVPPFDAAAVEEAATVLQRHFRRQSTRRAALATLSTLTSDFQSRQSAFAVPSSFTFQASPSATPASNSGSSTPPLAFGKPNAAFLGYEDFLVSLLSKIDAVESGGDRTVKAARKDLVKRVEAELEKLDAMKEHAWEVQSQQAEEVRQEKEEIVAVETEGERDAPSVSTGLSTAAALASRPESASPTSPAVHPSFAPAVQPPPAATEPYNSSDAEVAAPPAVEKPAVDEATAEPTSEESSAPVEHPAASSPSPAADHSSSSDDTAPATTPAPLTYAAVTALPASPSISPSSRARRASRASTHSVSSEESSQLEAYREVIRRARELGERVRQLEQKEEKIVTVNQESEAEEEGYDVL